VPYRHKLPAPAVVLTYEQLQKRAKEQRRREHQSKQQHIRQELIKRLSLAKQPVKAAAVCAKPLVRTAVSAARRLRLCCGARVPCNICYSVYSSDFDFDSVGSVCSPAEVDDCESIC
jgi:hypothetical protein